MADLTIAQVRGKFPEYSDLSDEQLAQGLHKKFYSDMPYEQFTQKIGFQSQPSIPRGEEARSQIMAGTYGKGLPLPGTPGSPERIAEVKRQAEVHPQPKPKQELPKNYTGEGLKIAGQLGALYAGGEAGAAAGIPFAPMTMGLSVPVGGLVGAGLGYAAEQQVERAIAGERPSMGKGLADIPKGVEIEAGGGALGPALGLVGKGFGLVGKAGKSAWDWATPTFRTATLEKEAGTRLAETMAGMGEREAAIAEKSAEVEKAVPGVKFTLAQKTGAPKIIQAEQEMKVEPKFLKERTRRAIQTNRAIESKMATAFPEQEGVGDVIEAAHKARQTAETGMETAGESAMLEAAALRGEPDIAGSKLLKLAHEEQAAAHKIVKEKFGKIDNTVGLDIAPVDKAISEIEKQKWGTAPGDYPSSIMGALKQFSTEKEGEITPFTFGDAAEMRSQISDAVRSEIGKGPLANNTLITRLNTLKSGVDKSIDALKDSPNKQVAKNYKEAVKYFRDEYVPRFKQGTTSDILSRTRTGEQKVEDALIAGEYFKPGYKGIQSARDFKTTFGDSPEAKQSLIEFARNDLYNKAVSELTGEINPATISTWINQHRAALKEHGIFDEFSSVIKASDRLKEAQATVDAFNKSKSAKLLGVDPDNAMKNVFTGEKDPATAMKELMALAKTDKTGAATKGLQSSMKDYIWNESLKKAEEENIEIGGQAMLKSAKYKETLNRFNPALEVLYKDAPQKLKAMRDIRDVVSILDRSNINISGGSDTAIKIGSVLKKTGEEAAGKVVPLYRLIIGTVNRLYTQPQIQKLILDAHFNPELADKLIRASKGEITTAQFKNWTDAYLEQAFKADIAMGTTAQKNSDTIEHSPVPAVQP